MLVITLSNALVTVGADGELKTLLRDAPWSGLYPNSSILGNGGKTLYIGMRQFIGRYDLRAGELRLLIPDKEFLNKLSPELEATLRKGG